MPLLGFQSRFAELVESGQKRQTIRAYRKDGRDPKVGDRLYLWTGLRQPGARKLGEATAENVRAIAIHRTRQGDLLYCEGWQQWTGAREALSKADGFDSWNDMVEWFHRIHGLPFRGLLIEWGEIEEDSAP